MSSLRLWPSFVFVLIATFFLGGVSRTSSSIAAAPATAAAGDDEDGADRTDDEQTEEKPAAPPVSPDEQAALTPQRGFSVRKEDAKIIDAFEDFRRHSQKKAWELAFKAVASITEKDPKGMVPAGDGLMMPTRQRVWQALASLPPDGREAYRLFNDANAKQRYDVATSGAADDVPALREIFQLYFVTSIGDKAADRLGDGCFEAGDFLAADAAWKAILDHYPDTSLSKTRLRVKRCAALSRAARWDAFDEVAASLGADGAAETVRLAGREGPAGAVGAAVPGGRRGEGAAGRTRGAGGAVGGVVPGGGAGEGGGS